MIKFPSYSSAILSGAVGIPVLILGNDYIEKNSASLLLKFFWFVIWFFLPVLISTADLRYIRKRIHEEGHTLFNSIRIMVRAEDFRQFYIPAFKRMLVYFVSACVSSLLLKLIGIDFG
jgi:hypothetical protein